MTFKEKLQIEHPDRVKSVYRGGCMCCPAYYDYEVGKPCHIRRISCTECWNREIPGTEPTKNNKGEESMNINAFKKFTKDDLKIGYVVKTKNGRLFMVMQSTDNKVIVDVEGKWTRFGDINDDLSVSMLPELNIEEVYGYSKWNYESHTISTNGRTLIWKRGEPVKKMTVEEIEKALGYKVEIVS